MTIEEFRSAVEELDVQLSEEQLTLFNKYADYLLEYNKHTNLTAIRTKEEVFLKHFYDSILVLKYTSLKDKSLLDIGSGAGFPGIPLKIIEPSIDLTLMDANGKKTAFLESLKNVLNINYTVINDRAEKYILNRREQIDVVTARAVTAMPVLAELTLPFVKIGGEFIAYKGDIDETLENGKYAIEVLGGEVLRVETTFLPKENAKRSFIFVNKKCKTDAMYPRLFDKISKKPLQK